MEHGIPFDALEPFALEDAFSRPGRRRARLLRVALSASDLVGLLAASAFVRVFFGFHPSTGTGFLLLLIGFATWVLAGHAYGLYEDSSTIDDVPRVILLATFVTWVSLLSLDLIRDWHPDITVTGAFWGFSIGFVLFFRVATRTFARRHAAYRERTLIVGAGKVGKLVSAKLALRPGYGIEVVGFVDDDPLPLEDDAPPYLGRIDRIERVIRAHRVERVIVAFSRMSGEELVDLTRECQDLGVQVDIVPRMFEVIGSRNQVTYVDGVPLVSLQQPLLSRPSVLAKRALDVTVALLALLFLSPFIAFAAWRIKRESPGPVVFKQERMGAGGRRFMIWKFRTMYADAEERKAELAGLNRHTESGPRMFKIPADPRITPFGQFLRNWSLDELPQLVNVLRGEMSLVGPRPLILDEDDHVTGSKRRRLHLAPGLTGLWQVLGRSDLPFAEMVTLDYLYVTNWSLWGDVKLLVRTVPVVLQRRGAY